MDRPYVVRRGSPHIPAAAWALLVVLCSCESIEPWPPLEEREQLLEIVQMEFDAPPQAAALLEEALGSSYPGVRARAARALKRLSPAPDLRLFLRLLAGDPDAAVRREAAWALGELGDPAARPSLIDGARDPAVEVRAACVRALGQLPAPPGFPGPSLEEFLRDEDPSVRREAVLGLGRSGGETATDLLKRLAVSERDERVRWCIYRALAWTPPRVRECQKELSAAVADENFLVAAFSLDGLRAGECAEAAPAIVAPLREHGRFWIVEEAGFRALTSFLASGQLVGEDRARVESFLREVACGSGFEARHARVRRALSDAHSGGSALETREPGASGLNQVPAFLSWCGAPRAFFTALPPRTYGLLSVRNPRAEVRISGRGTIFLELYAMDAPRHVARFVALARAGCLDGRRVVEAGGPAGIFLLEEDDPSPSERLQPERFHTVASRGAVLSVSRRILAGIDRREPAEWCHDAGGAGIFIALVPLPEIEREATLWGRVALGIEVADKLTTADVIESVQLVE